MLRFAASRFRLPFDFLAQVIFQFLHGAGVLMPAATICRRHSEIA